MHQVHRDAHIPSTPARGEVATGSHASSASANPTKTVHDAVQSLAGTTLSLVQLTAKCVENAPKISQQPALQQGPETTTATTSPAKLRELQQYHDHLRGKYAPGLNAMLHNNRLTLRAVAKRKHLHEAHLHEVTNTAFEKRRRTNLSDLEIGHQS